MVSAVEQFLMSGDEYKESLRDGRRIVAGGQQVEDVTTHPAFAPAVDRWAEWFDAQLAPETQDLTTFVHPDLNARVSAGWLVPRSAADYQTRRNLLNYSTDQTLGMWGRPPDYGPTFTMGFIAEEMRLEEREPGSAAKIEAFIERQTATTAPRGSHPGSLGTRSDRSIGPSPSDILAWLHRGNQPGTLLILRNKLRGP